MNYEIYLLSAPRGFVFQICRRYGKIAFVSFFCEDLLWSGHFFQVRKCFRLDADLSGEIRRREAIELQTIFRLREFSVGLVEDKGWPNLSD